MLANWTEPIASYSEVKKGFFDKYKRKMKAIIDNIDDNSLTESDKIQLKKELSEMLLKTNQ